MKKRHIVYLALSMVLFVILTTCNLLEGDPAVVETVKTPIIDIQSDSYDTAQTVTITTETEGATIKYTIDGTDPLISTTSIIGEAGSGTATVTVDSSLTLRTFAYKSGWLDSPVSSAVYIITSGAPVETVEAPVIDIPSGTYETAQAVTITSGTAGATVKYTTDGTDPLTSTTFSIGVAGSGTATVTVDSTLTLKAHAYKSGMYDSPVSSETYIIGSATAVGPDYTVSSPVYPLNVIPAAAMEGSFRITNSSIAGTEDITWTVYVSSDGTYDTGDTELETGTQGALAVGGESGVITFSGDWPADPTGYYIIITLSAADDMTAANDTLVSSLIPLGVNGRFVAVGAAGRITYSQDGGATWTASTDTDLGASVFTGIAVAGDNERLVAVGESAIGAAVAFYSDDGGENWTASVVPITEPLLEVTWGEHSTEGGLFVAVAESVTTGKIIYSSDPSLSWTVGSVGVRNYVDVAFGADTFVAVTSSHTNIAVYSIDGGATWVDASSGIGGTNSFLLGIVYASTRFVAAGAVTNPLERFYHSNDGITWSIVNPSGVAAGYMRAAAYDGTTNILAVGDNGRIWITSNEGDTWGIAAGSTLPDSNLQGVAFGGGVWVVTGTAVTGNIWRTTNPAAAWTAINESANTLNDIIYIP